MIPDEPRKATSRKTSADRVIEAISELEETLSKPAKSLNGSAQQLRDQAKHQMVLIRWLFLCVFVIVIIGFALIIFMLQTSNRIHEVRDTSNRIELLVHDVGENNKILRENRSILCDLPQAKPLHLKFCSG